MIGNKCLSTLLTGSGSLKSRMKCLNPYSTQGHLNINCMAKRKDGNTGSAGSCMIAVMSNSCPIKRSELDLTL